MKKQVYFITSAKINYNIDNKDIYDSFDLVSKAEADTVLSEEADDQIINNKFLVDIKKVDKIYTATSGQTYDTAKRINLLLKSNQAQIQRSDCLSGIKFSMGQLIVKEKFNSMKYKDAIKVARKKFVEKFFSDQLLEAKEDVVNRMDELLYKIKHDKEKNILCIGHAFYLKILQAYIYDKNLINNKEGLISFFEPDKKPFGSLDGFVINVNK